jgi:hypothetical protein
MPWPPFAIFGAAAVLAALGLRNLLRSIRKGWINRIVRTQHNLFVLRLRDLVFRDPCRYLSMLLGDQGEWFARKLWQETGDSCARVSLPGGSVGLDRFMGPDVPDPHPLHLPDMGMAVHPFQLPDASALAIVTLPEPQETGETDLIGIWLPSDRSLEQDLVRARTLVRFFILNRWSSGRGTDFCEFTVQGKTLTYNVGAPRDPLGFAKVIQARIEDERVRRASQAAVGRPRSAEGIKPRSREDAK